MRARWALACATMLTVALGISYACTPFSADGSDAETPDSSTPGTSSGADSDTGAPASDGGPTDLDAGSPPSSDAASPAEYDMLLADASATAHCYDFRKATGGFTVAGNVTHDDQGFSFQVPTANTRTTIRRTFDLTGDLKISSVALDVTLTPTGQLDNNNDAVDIFTQFNGTPAVYEGTAQNAFEVTKAGFDIDIWYGSGAGAYDGAHAVAPDAFPSGSGTLNGPVWIDTEWNAGGGVSVSAGGKTVRVSGNTVTKTSKSYTLEIGGSSNTSKGSVKLRVRSVCVAFH